MNESSDPVHSIEDASSGETSSGKAAHFLKAYRKARSWHCGRMTSAVVALRYAFTGDSGQFMSHGRWRISRISR